MAKTYIKSGGQELGIGDHQTYW